MGQTPDLALSSSVDELDTGAEQSGDLDRGLLLPCSNRSDSATYHVPRAAAGQRVQLPSVHSIDAEGPIGIRDGEQQRGVAVREPLHAADEFFESRLS